MDSELLALIVDEGFVFVVAFLVLIYAARKVFKDEPQRLEDVIKNNSELMKQNSISTENSTKAIEAMNEVLKTLNESMERNNEVNRKTLEVAKIADSKLTMLIRLALKYEVEDADEAIKDIETDVKDKMYQKRYQQEGGNEWTK